MEPYDTGLKDQDGDRIEVWIPGRETIAARKIDKAGPKLTKNQQTMYSILRDAGQGGLSAEQWNAKCREVGVGDKRKADIYDNRASLRDKHMVREFNGIWRANI